MCSTCLGGHPQRACPMQAGTMTSSVHTPLRPQVFARFLSSNPDQAFIPNLIYSLTYGLDIGYTGPHLPVIIPNLASAYQHPNIVDEALIKEVAEQRMAGPYPTPPYSILRCSGLRTFRIDTQDYSLQYKTVDDAIEICQLLGPGAPMTKVD